ncbi:sulfite exporter TauE/SafE family protein [Bradyrhizobium sp.]|uniref:sulfite exporter TauE/SafE family protein n=1 Tax=Bradyrhizobium sp. TaxID=376 RepID=UPI001D596E2C|nr:sulfite exporter TauE/SafE family protein [Bradyrhizobium sp.]MBI5319568.1 sulfite exporter TauE/SafE family protein [Bradyrhizobium sp.]
MNFAEIIGGLVTGLAGGLFSGFLGVTAGGVLVPLLILILGKEQHIAQGISLVAQIVPTSLSGVRNYSRSGHRISLRWLIWLAAGFGVGGCVGALFAVHVPDRALQWCFVAYLVILLAIMLLRSQRSGNNGADDVPEDVPLHWATLGAIGAVAGWSSGFLGIGGGLAITALMAGIAGLSQHRAQAMSLAVTALPVTLPAALLYVQQGTELPWLAIAALIAGLWIGTDIGARFANRVSPDRLRLSMIVIIAAMALFMAFKAWR